MKGGSYRESWLTVIVGARPTGVELASVLAEISSQRPLVIPGVVQHPSHEHGE
jgi:hypothetical protein